MFEESKRAVEIMTRRQVEQRATARSIINQPGTVLACEANGSEHVALVRDVSASGLYFYSDFRPQPGARLALRFLMPVLDRKVPMQCEVEVIRVEKGENGAAVGIGARLHGQQFVPPAEA
jgi:PilZ domain-containing protein